MKAQSSEALLLAIVKCIGDGIMVTDSEGHVTFMNAMAETLTGWTQGDAVGKPLHDVFILAKDKTAPKAKDTVAAAVKRGVAETFGIDPPLTARNGTQLVTCGTCAPLRDDKGSIHGIILLFRDSSGASKLLTRGG